MMVVTGQSWTTRGTARTGEMALGSHYIPQQTPGYVLVRTRPRREAGSVDHAASRRIAHGPNAIRDPRCHRRSHADRLVNAAEVVEREPARNGCPVILPFLRKGIRQARRTLMRVERFWRSNRSANAFGVRLTHDWDYFFRRPEAFCRLLSIVRN